MKREEAKTWATIPREKLAVLASHLDKHFDALCAYANGAEIQMQENGGKWIDRAEPSFCFSREYRVKPSTKHPAATEKLVESLDGKPLSDAEKKILRTLRDCKYEVVGQSEFAFVNDEERLDTNIGVLMVFPFENNIVDEEFAGALRKLSNGKEEAQ